MLLEGDVQACHPQHAVHASRPASPFLLELRQVRAACFLAAHDGQRSALSEAGSDVASAE